MTLKHLLSYIGKLLLCGVALSVGTVIGGAIATFLALPLPSMPAGVDSNVIVYMQLSTPLLALALAILSPNLAGGFGTRALVLALLMWIAYSLNTQLEASIFSKYAVGFWFAVISSLFASVLCAVAVAYLFPPISKRVGFAAATRTFFSQRDALSWMWRFALAAIAFAPIYFFFGLLVTPFTLDYYRQNMFGLALPTIEQILPILFLRSALFLIACLPVIIAWQKSASSLFYRLSAALYILVGFVYMLISTWLPASVRIPHALEILADEFVYAGVLVLLLSVARGLVMDQNSRAQRTVP